MPRVPLRSGCSSTRSTSRTRALSVSNCSQGKPQDWHTGPKRPEKVGMPSWKSANPTGRASRTTSEMTLDPTTRTGAWYLASRPHTLPAALTPVFVAAGLAIGDDVFGWGPLVATAIGALAIQVAANFTNDLSDARKGADNEARIGPQRAVASGILSERAMSIGT